MNACMYFCISIVLCFAPYAPRLFITKNVISHRFIYDCVYFFPLDSEPFAKIWIYTDYVRVFSCFLLPFLVLFAVYIFIVHRTVFYLYKGYVWACDIPVLTSLSLFCHMFFGDTCSVYLFCSLFHLPPFLGFFRRHKKCIPNWWL